jgi:hypothetical protein
MVTIPSKADAQTCVTKYSGCTWCDNAYGSEWWCWSLANSSLPYATSGYGLCRARTPLPVATTGCEPPQPGPGLLNVHRFYIPSKTDHFLTLNWSEGVSAGGLGENVAFIVYTSPPDADYRLLYRCRVSSQDHFVSEDPNCEGTVNEGSYGYVSTIPRSGLVPIYRFYKNSQTDHLTTKDYNEGVSWGAAYEGIQGYVPQ